MKVRRLQVEEGLQIGEGLQVVRLEGCRLKKGSGCLPNLQRSTNKNLPFENFQPSNLQRIQFQIFATWIFYAVLNDLCSQVAVALNQPKERISVEMVFRGLYHFARALMRSESTDVVTYLVEHHQLLSLVKAERKRHRENAAHSSQIWAGSG